jgi:hypothetical protein
MSFWTQRESCLDGKHLTREMDPLRAEMVTRRFLNVLFRTYKSVPGLETLDFPFLNIVIIKIAPVHSFETKTKQSHSPLVVW